MGRNERIAWGLRIPRALHDRVTEIARRERRSTNEQYVYMIESTVGFFDQGESLYPERFSPPVRPALRAAVADISSANGDPTTLAAHDRDDWSLTNALSDVRFVSVTTYWLRFWYPYLGAVASALYLQLLVEPRDDQGLITPSLAALARTLGVDRRSLYGRQKGNQSYAGAIDVLIHAGLIAPEAPIDGVRRTFRIVTSPGLLSIEQVATLDPHIQRDHAKWMARADAKRT